MDSIEVVEQGSGTSARWARRAGWLLGLGIAVVALSSCLPPGAQKDATQVSAGQRHTCAVVANGTVVCWGFNEFGQLGDGTNFTRISPVAVPGLTGVTSLSAGTDHTCAVDGSGTTRCWGRNAAGQLGDGTTTDRSSPVAVLTGATVVSAGRQHTCATLSGGAIRCWGLNTSGQLGDDSTNPSLVPVPTTGVSTATSVSVGDSHSCARLAGGTARCWGFNGSGGLGDGTTTTRLAPVAVSGLTGLAQIDAGAAFSCARLDDGTARCWGASNLGQTGTVTSSVLAPATVPGVAGATSISAGLDHACAVIDGGKPVCWGSNLLAKLGNGSNLGLTCLFLPQSCVGGVGRVKDREPHELVGQPDSFFDSATQVAAGGTHTCAVKSNGTIKCWGRGVEGQLGDAWDGRCTADGEAEACREAVYVGIDTPVPVVSGPAKLSTSANHTCAVDTNQRMRCWGPNTSGQLGGGNALFTRKALSVRGLANVVGVSTGGDHSCAVLSNGTVSCWGRALASSGSGTDGRLGYASVTGAGVSEASPRTVTGGDREGPPAITTATQVALGARHSCALLADGTVRCWGANDNAQLGNDGAGASSMVPQIACLSFAGTCLEPLSGVVAISAGIDHTCALRGTGTVACWGSNTAGQVGPPPTGSTPTDIPGITGATLLASGDEHNCVALGAGGLRCWGRNSSGQFGDGTIFSNGVPQPTSGITGVVTSLDAGSMHTCAVVGGALSCWGENHRGQLGGGTTGGVLSPADGCGASGAAPPATQGACVPTPLAVTAVADVATVTTGRSHTCVGLASGQVRCWGGNDVRQLGALVPFGNFELIPIAPVMPPGG